jgi:hypothetical protein
MKNSLIRHLLLLILVPALFTVFLAASASSPGLTQPPDTKKHVSQDLQAPLPGALDTLASESTSPTSQGDSGARYATRGEDGQIVYGGKKYPARTYRALFMPNDPAASQPWVAQSEMASAWDTPSGTAPTTLAIIDTGFALKHEELSDRWYKNAGEQGQTVNESSSILNCTDRNTSVSADCNLIDDDGDGVVDNEFGMASKQNPSRLNCTAQLKPLAKDCNLIDDDSNGFIDDVSGWDFIHNDNSVQAGEIPVDDPADGKHGTYVAGVAAATGNNGKGIAGVNWGATLLPIQALDDDGTGDTAAVANAIRYATAHDADVISLSLGSEYADDLVRQAVLEAIASGAVVVAAAGNDGCACVVYPANYPEVISVGALNASNQPASFSSYGVQLDIMAPGVNMYTTSWRNDNPISAYASGISGTSLATPIVSGILTRMKSQQPSATPLQLTAALLESTKRTSLPDGVSRSDTVGFGLLDANVATKRMATPYAPTIQYAFSHISLGTLLDPMMPSEVASRGYPYVCPNDRPGSTPIYELTKQNSPGLFTASAAELSAARQAGYAAEFFAYACLAQSHDTPSAVRTMNIYSEFFNRQFR